MRQCGEKETHEHMLDMEANTPWPPRPLSDFEALKAKSQVCDSDFDWDTDVELGAAHKDYLRPHMAPGGQTRLYAKCEAK